MSWYLIYTTVATALGAGACWAFCIDYYRLSRGFRRSEYWWIFMGFPASLGILLTFLLVARLVPNSFGRQLIGAILYTVLLAVIPMKHRLMRKSMTRGRREARGEQGVRTPKKRRTLR